MIADGMAQLQAAMIKQLDKGAEGDRSPEQVKPGTTALPLLKEVAAETACVDVMDWLEMIDGPMSDLSDSSAGWWRAVMSEANPAYGIWTQAAPLDKLSIAPDPTNLENGKFSRLNSRAAAMIIASLHDSVKQEVVARSCSNSVEGLVALAEEMYRVARTSPGSEPIGSGTSLIKSTLQIDTNPSYDKVDSEAEACEAGGTSYLWNTFFLSTTGKGNDIYFDIFLNSAGRLQCKENSTCVDFNNTKEWGREGAPTPNDLKDVLADVGKVLKAMQATSLKRAKVQELQADEFADNGLKEAMARMRKFVDEKVVFEDDGKEEFTRDLGNTEFLAPPDGLLDSGASHAMRAATNKAYQSGHPVSVTLAGEDVKVLRQNKQGTILVESEQGPVQAIVPLGAIIQDLGYTLSWGPKHLKLSHPEKGPIKVKINNNCPEVTACDALALIRDLELTKVATLNAHTLKARLEVLKLEEKRDWPELMKEYMKDGRRGTLLKALLKCPFTKGLPSDVHSMLLEDFNLDDGMKYLKDLPIARRRRKSLMNSRSWVVSLYGGDSASVDPFKLVPAAGKTLLEIDIKNSRMWDVHRGYRQGRTADAHMDVGYFEGRSWSQQFKHLVLEGVSDFHSGTWVEEEELVNVGAKLSKLTKEQRELWKKHLLNDHQPYRADCSVCINAQASGYQHRRRRHHHLYTVALDVAGPFKTKGRDMEFDDYKYILVASYRCPKDYIAAKAIPDLDAELYVPDTDEDEQPDDEVLQSEDELLQPDQEESGIEEELEIHGPPTVDEVVEELQEPIETKTIYLARPMRRRTTSATLLAAKEMMVQLRQNGLYVNAIHTDRAREFGSRAFKAWIGECGVRHTKTARGDPAGNSTAELGVKWLKSRVRALLRSSGAGATEWPMAVNHAVMGLWSKAFPSSPWTSPPAAPFGSEVWFRAKAYKGTKEKAKDPTDVRWKRGFYRGPATDVSRGHLLMREDGGLVIAKGVKFNVLDPASELRDLLPPMTAEGLEADECEVEHASRKQLVAEVEFISKCLLSEENFDLKETLKLYNKLEELGDVDFRVGKKTAATSWYTGAYVHGGCAGLRRNLQSFPNTSKYLVSLGKKYAKGEGFSAVALARNATLGMHRDSHNYKHSKNIVVPISRFEGGALWAEDPDVEEKDNVPKQTSSGQEVRGRLHPMRQGEPVMFSPRRWHEVQQWEGDRVMLMLYTPRATKLAEKDAATLEEFGFPLDRKALDRDPEELDEGETEKSLQEEPKLFSVQLQDKLEPIVFIEVEDEDLFDGEEIGSKAKSLNRIVKTEAQQAAKAINKKAELQYTNNIEEIIKLHEEKGTPLDVTHAVSLQEVKKNLPAWRSSALKEYHNLKDNKRAFEVRKKHELPPGCRIVPCKGVYTVKPDKDGLYRRKTRFVACGNHVPEGQEGMELFAAGLDATTLRTMLAYTIDQPWAYGTTDIRQVFVLAPWLGQAVALQPPAIAYELGLAEPGDYWFVLMSIYGLRESPALWSKFRDEQLEGARWTAVIDGKEERLRLRQMVTDDQVWKIEREQGDQQPLGYIMVYVDDILINSLPEAMRSFYEWLASRWECDNLDVLGENHPIRFLGMEVHLVDSGIELAQEGFIRELLRSHGHDGSRAKTQGPKDTMVLTLEEEEAMITAQPSDLSGREDEVKMAQRRVGELLWLSGRTRPDVQYVTALLSSRITRCPEIVNQVGIRMLSYLNETLHYRIRFSQPEVPMDHIKVFTDSSFAPSSGRSHGSAGVFVNNNPVSWRSSRQQLVTLSTAESELLEAVEGVVLANATATLVSELRGCRLPVHLHIDNQSALMLLNGSTGSWRTRHLRLRANYVRERLQLGEIHLQYEPGATQRADLGTKPFTKERLSQLIKLWNIIDRRSTEATVRAASATSSPTWLSKLLMFCQLCGVTAQKEQIQAEVPWDLYLVVLVLAIAVIGIWEGGKHCCRGKEIRLQALRSRASYGKLTRIELKELQRLLALEPGDLTDQQGERLLYLKDLFEQSMPSNTSPVPTVPLDTPHRMQ
ncbi:RE1, partial [Symbiodinium sp. KB8]